MPRYSGKRSASWDSVAATLDGEGDASPQGRPPRASVISSHHGQPGRAAGEAPRKLVKN